MQIGSGPPSPQQMMETQLSKQVEAGDITSEDSDAMLAALEAIHDDMAPDQTASTEPPSQEEMQTKLEGLLSEQVEAGTLTSEQADELAAMFESGEMGPPPPPGGMGGAPMGPPPSDSAESESESEDLVAKLLEELSAANSDSYSSEGTSSSSSDVTSLFADYLA